LGTRGHGLPGNREIILNKMEDREQERQWVQAWQRAGPLLAKLRREEIRQADTAAAILQLEDAFQAALRQHQLPQTSGLVEQQKWFARLKP
jgi:hypothetical protein